MRYIILILSGLAMAALLEAYAFQVRAETNQPELQIIAVLPNPSADDRTAEWIELYNPGSNKVDLNLYSLQVATGSALQISVDSLPLEAKQTIFLVRDPESIAIIFPEAKLHKLNFALVNRPTTLLLKKGNITVSEFQYSDSNIDSVTIFATSCLKLLTVHVADFDPSLALSPAACSSSPPESAPKSTVPVPELKPKAEIKDNSATIKSLYEQLLKTTGAQTLVSDTNAVTPKPLYSSTGTIPKKLVTWGQVVGFFAFNFGLVQVCFESQPYVRALRDQFQRRRQREKIRPP